MIRQPLFLLALAAMAIPAIAEESLTPTREFAIKNDRAFLGGQEVKLWGLRCGNALNSEAITERHIRNFDNMVAHGINVIGVYIQGSNAGWPDADAALNGFTRDGKLKAPFARRLETLVREADRRGMVVMVGLFTHRKDQEFYDDAAIQKAIEESARFLSERKLRNTFVDIVHEFSHPERMDQETLPRTRRRGEEGQTHPLVQGNRPRHRGGRVPGHQLRDGRLVPRHGGTDHPETDANSRNRIRRQRRDAPAGCLPE